MFLWLFYPENDIALANNTTNFTAPPAAVKLQRSGEILPLWMCSPADRVFCNGVNARWLENIQRQFNIEADVWNHEDFSLSPTPWGWSKASRKIFAQNGFPASSLPSDAQLATYRNLSHRRTASILSQKLAAQLDFPIWPAAIESDNVEEVERLIDQYGKIVVKAPWSSSGRGVKFIDSPKSLQQIAGTIRKQGSVMVEQFAPEHFDFALLYYCSDGKAEFQGYSVFESDTDNASYKGNIVAPQEELKQIIDSKSSASQLAQIIPAIESILSSIVADKYSGPVGVDMFYSGSGLFHVVELNLRYTMGFVALGLARYVNAKSVFRVELGDTTSQCIPIIENDKLIAGKLALTPPGGDFTFTLSVE